MDLRDYLGVLARRRMAIVVVALVVTAAAVAAGIVLADETVSRAVATVPAVRAEGVIAPMPREAAFERELEIARSGSVFERAAEATGESPGSIRALVVVAPASATTLNTIIFTATSTDPEHAAAMANAVAEAYVAVANESLLADLELLREAVRAGSAEAADRALGLIERLGDTPAGPPGVTVDPGADELEERLAHMTALMGMESARAQLVSAAAPSVPEGDLGRNMVLGLTLGLFLGVAAALVQEQLDDRVRGAEAVRRRLPGAPVFDATGTKSRSRADALRLVASILRAPGPGVPAKTVLVTAPTGAAPSGAVAAGLAGALAERGDAVVGVWWGQTSFAMTERLGASDGPGMAEVLDETADVRDALVETRVAGVRVLGPGTLSDDTAAALFGAAASRVLDECAAGADAVIVDAAPLGEYAVAGHLAGAVDGVVLVVRDGVTRLPELDEAAFVLEELGMTLRAVVLTGAEA